MLSSIYRGTIDSYLFRMRRLAIRSSSKWPHVDFEIDYTAYESSPSSISIPNHHQTKSPIGITRYGGTYGRPSATSGVPKSTLIGDR